MTESPKADHFVLSYRCEKGRYTFELSRSGAIVMAAAGLKRERMVEEVLRHVLNNSMGAATLAVLVGTEERKISDKTMEQLRSGKLSISDLIF